jgi:hypothetical protein
VPTEVNCGNQPFIIKPYDAGAIYKYPDDPVIHKPKHIHYVERLTVVNTMLYL